MPSLQVLIDRAVMLAGGEPGHEDKTPRGHLGASQIGRPCAREIWYGFRWAAPKAFDGRMLRLFATGFKYEDRFEAVLGAIGITVEQIDPATRDRLFYHGESDSWVKVPAGEEINERVLIECDDLSDREWARGLWNWQNPNDKLNDGKQYRFIDHTGHFSGSMDGKAHGFESDFMDSRGVAYGTFNLLIDEKVLTEFKTHGIKSFNALKESGVRIAKPEHYAQMVTYMDKMGLRLALYCAVFKDTDELYFEFVAPDPAYAVELGLKANIIITSQQPPLRISNTPHAFVCKYCDYRLSCQFGQPVAKNCRTCRFSYPTMNATWTCGKWKAVIPFDAQQTGCHAYEVLAY